MTEITALGDVYRLLERHAAERPEAAALVSARGRTMTYRALAAAVSAASTRLTREGMQPGDAVLFSVRPSVEAIVLILAAVRAGGAIVAADPGMGSGLFARRMAAVQPHWVMAESVLYALSANRVARRLLRRRGLVLPQVGRLPGVCHVRVGRRLPGTPPSLPASRLMAPLPGPADPAVDLQPEDAAFIVFTAGTTDDPRAVVHTARSLAATLDTSLRLGGLEANSVVVTDQLHSALPALLAGARVHLPRIGAEPAGIMRLLAGARATHTFAVPSDLHRLVSYCEQQGKGFPESLREVVLGAGPVERPLLARLAPLLPAGCRVTSYYALTEMPLVARVTLEEKLAWRGEGDLAGTPVEGARVRVNEQGELHAAGPRLCGRYLGGEPLTEVATGDLARIDDAGRIILLGRAKEMIIRGQHNIYPALYEDRIATLPGVERCALVGVWDGGRADERVVLVLEPAAGEADAGRLRRRVERALQHGDLIDHLALPDEVVVMPLPEAGRTRKIDRAALRRLLAARPG